MNVGLWNTIDWFCCACSLFQSCKICCNNLCSEKCQNLLHWINIKLSLCSLWSCDHGGIFEALQAVIVWCEGQFVCRTRSHICQTLPFFFGVSSHLYMRTSRRQFGSLISMHTCRYLWNAHSTFVSSMTYMATHSFLDFPENGLTKKIDTYGILKGSIGSWFWIFVFFPASIY